MESPRVEIKDPGAIVKTAIAGMIDGGVTGRFVTVVEACKKLSSHAKTEILEQVKGQIRKRLENVDVSSMATLVSTWNDVLKDAKRLQSVLKYLVVPVKEDTLPKWKAKEEKKKRASIGTEIAMQVWKSDVYPKAKVALRDEIDRMASEIQQGKSGAETAAMFAKMEDLGFSTFDPVVNVLNRKYEQSRSGMSESQRVLFLLDELKKLESIYPKAALQKAVIVPKIPDLVSPLVTKRDTATMVKLKDALVGEFSSVYSEAVMTHIRGLQMPVDFFSIAAIASFFSSVLYSDAAIRTVISAHIVKNETQMIQEFVGVLFSHFDMPDNIKQLTPVVRCFTKHEMFGNELARGFLLRILLKRSTNKDKEINFLKLLDGIFPGELLRASKTMLHELTITKDYLITNVSLSMPLMSNDTAVFPDDLIRPVETGFQQLKSKYTNRKFKFAATFSLALVKGTWKGQEYLLTMSVLQYSILQMILKGDMNFKKTGASTASLNFAMKLLIKGGLIKKVGPRFEFPETPPKEKKINVYNGAINIRNVEHAQAVEEQDHTLAIQSVAARIMKAARRAERKDLENKIKTELSEKFKVRDNQIESVIKGLLESEYLEVDSNDTRYLLYVP